MQSREGRPSTMLHPLFVAAVLEGFEGTLDEVVGRVENPELNAQLERICAVEAKAGGGECSDSAAPSNAMVKDVRASPLSGV